MTRLAGLVVACLLVATWARADLVRELDNPVLRPLGRALAVSVAKALPVPAASSGITFEFNPKTSAFERSTEVLGQLFLERARPIGRGKLNVSLTYQYVDVDTYEGRDLGSLSDLRPLRDPSSGIPFVIRRLDTSLVAHQTTASVTYGATDELELNLTIPVLHTTIDLSGQAKQLGGRSLPFQSGAGRETATGIGDIFVRGKYRLLHGWLGELAAGLVFRLPSGSRDDFQGTGLLEVGPRLYASTPVATLAPHVRVQAFVNAGLDLTPENSRRHEGRYGAGFDVMLASRVTFSLAFLAREPFARLMAPGTVDVARANGTRTPLFGIDPGHARYYDLSIGGRVNLWRDTVFLMGNVIVPVNDDGVRASVIPLVGIEAAF